MSTPYEGIGVELVALSPRFPNEMLVGMRPYQGLVDVYRMNLTDGSSVLDTENPGDVTRWIVDNAHAARSTRIQGLWLVCQLLFPNLIMEKCPSLRWSRRIAPQGGGNPQVRSPN